MHFHVQSVYLSTNLNATIGDSDRLSDTVSALHSNVEITPLTLNHHVFGRSMDD